MIVHEARPGAGKLQRAVVICLLCILPALSPHLIHAQGNASGRRSAAGVAISGASPGSAAPRLGDYRRLEIFIYDYAGVPVRARERAEDEASYILGKTGLHAEWLVCVNALGPAEVQGGCRQISDSEHLCLLIVPHTGVLPPPAVAYTPLSSGTKGRYITIFYDRILQLADSSGLSLSIVLGCVFAHEMGHVLLGPDSHSPEGIMRALWSREDLKRAGQRRLGFSEEQSMLLQAAVVARNRQDVEHIGQGKDGAR